jgi:enoyl-CoA hydratase/carnithine racemase
MFIGSGTAFSSGFDLDEFNKPEIYKDLIKSSSKYHKDIWNFSQTCNCCS